MSDKNGKLELTEWGKFIHRYSVTNSISFWNGIRQRVEAAMDVGSDWEFILAEIEQGCKELREGKLQEIICIEDEGL